MEVPLLHALTQLSLEWASNNFIFNYLHQKILPLYYKILLADRHYIAFSKNAILPTEKNSSLLTPTCSHHRQCFHCNIICKFRHLRTVHWVFHLVKANPLLLINECMSKGYFPHEEYRPFLYVLFHASAKQLAVALNIIATRLLTTHCFPAFFPNNSSLPWWKLPVTVHNSFMHAGPGLLSMSLKSLIFLYKLWWFLSVNTSQQLLETTLFLRLLSILCAFFFRLLFFLFTWYSKEILETNILLLNTTFSKLVKYWWPWNSSQYFSPK